MYLKFRYVLQNTLIDNVKELTESVLKATDFFLVDIEIKGNREPVVWVYIDAEDRGVNMDECAEFSNELSFLLDAHEVFDGSYRLNVSSPGVTRPLTDRRQYAKNSGRKCRIKFRENGEYLKLEGVLEEVNEEDILLKLEDDSTRSINFDQIVETKIIPSIN